MFFDIQDPPQGICHVSESDFIVGSAIRANFGARARCDAFVDHTKSFARDRARVARVPLIMKTRRLHNQIGSHPGITLRATA